jgi:ParB family chromosome partitioning protein
MKRSIPRSLVSKATSPDTSKERTPGPEGRAETGDAVSTPF